MGMVVDLRRRGALTRFSEMAYDRNSWLHDPHWLGREGLRTGTAAMRVAWLYWNQPVHVEAVDMREIFITAQIDYEESWSARFAAFKGDLAAARKKHGLDKPKRRRGWDLLGSLPAGTTIYGVTVFNGVTVLSTDRGVALMRDGLTRWANAGPGEVTWLPTGSELPQRFIAGHSMGARR